MGQFRDALDKQFPPKTDEQRAAYYAVRRHLDARTPAWQFIAAGSVLLAIALFLWTSSANAAPVFAPAMSAAAVSSQRNSQECEQSKSVHCANWSVAGGTWESGPCKGRSHFECTPLPVRKDR